MLLKVNGLSCGYDNRAVVENLNFEIGKGELWCILGANGIGKSTLFKTLLGLLHPIAGEVSYCGKSLGDWKRKELAKIVSYVPQSHTPPFPFRVFDVVAMGRHPYQSGFGKVRKEDIEVVDHALSLLKIRHLSDKIYTQISGGERQLVLLARAIVQETPLMILDEPVSNLDFGNHAKVISHIRTLVSMGKTVIMTTHCPDHAFIPESHVLLLEGRDSARCGMGSEIVTEQCIHDMYDVNNRILTYQEGRGKTCIPLY